MEKVKTISARVASKFVDTTPPKPSTNTLIASKREIIYELSTVLASMTSVNY